MPLDFTGKTQEEAAAMKAEAIADALSAAVPLEIGPASLLVTVWEAWFDGMRLGVRTTATSDGTSVPTDSSYYFVNPPIKVEMADGTAVEDVLAAGSQIVYDAVEKYVNG